MKKVLLLFMVIIGGQILAQTNKNYGFNIMVSPIWERRIHYYNDRNSKSIRDTYSANCKIAAYFQSKYLYGSIGIGLLSQILTIEDSDFWTRESWDPRLLFAFISSEFYVQYPINTRLGIFVPLIGLDCEFPIILRDVNLTIEEYLYYYPITYIKTGMKYEAKINSKIELCPELAINYKLISGIEKDQMINDDNERYDMSFTTIKLDVGITVKIKI